MEPSGAVAGADIARSPTANPGPAPLARAVLGLLVGAGAGVVAALLTPRPDRARRQTAPARSVHASR